MSKKKMSGVVFDDDDSDEDLESFREEMRKKVDPSALAPVDDDDDDDDSDDDNDDHEDSENDSESDEDSDLDEEDDDDLPQQQIKDNSVINSKLGKLNSMLASFKSGGDDDDSSEEESDDNDDIASDNDDNENEDQGEDSEDNIASEASDEDTEKSSKNKDEKSAKNFQDKKSAKRKSDNNEAKNSKKPKILIEEDEREKYRSALSNLSVEKILEIKSSLGDKVFNSKWEGGGNKGTKKPLPDFKRDNKNRPREISSKKRVPKFVEVVQVAKVVKRDPRFDPLCGEFDKKEFRKSYKFLKGVKEKELVTLKDQLKEAKSEDRANLKYLIQRTENQLRAEKMTEEAELKSASQTAERIQAMNRGEKPVFKSKKTIREEELVKSYETLKEKGTVDKHIRKLNKKNVSKDRKMLGKSVDI